MRKICCGAALLFSLGNAYAQGVYMPRNIKQAYAKGTRSPDGKPGKWYWQNTATYDIHITAAPPSQVIKGTETIVYHNQSRDTLKTLVIRLIDNIHKPQASRSNYAGKQTLSAGFTVDTFTLNGKAQAFNNDVGTVAPVRLGATPLLPGDSVQLYVTWHYELPLQSGREGMIDTTTQYLAYFYPRVAVYDDYNGWDMIEHTDRTEFYNDFNNYRLSVTVPRNYVVWSTGTLENAAAVLQPAVAERLRQSFTTDSVLHIATQQMVNDKAVTAQNDQNTWIWTAHNVSDLAVGISNTYIWDGASAVVDSATMRRASMQAAYRSTAEDFHHSVAFGQFALTWFSHHWPGVAYPFPKMTAFQGFADMEYPMMVNDGTVNDLRFAQLLQDHEMAHTYFPFYMGINETRYAYMDEGWATTLEYLIGIAEFGQQKADDFYKTFRVKRYISDNSTEEDMPIISMSNQVSGMGYGSNAYGKPSMAYLSLKDLLGDALFRKGLHAYMDRWHGKHPIPWDFFYSLNNATGQDLSWFWNNWFFSYNYIDLAVASVHTSAKQTVVVVHNTGGFAIPFDVILTNATGSTKTYHQTPAVWKANQQQATITLPTGQVKEVTLENGIYLDATPADNTWKP
ncbi:aminopeptidase [Chitinophaga costaii]|nr:aminopeptidase [Chitinophaga costaii]